MKTTNFGRPWQVLFSEERWESAGGAVDPIFPLLGVEPGASILDIGCGPSRHTLEYHAQLLHLYEVVLSKISPGLGDIMTIPQNTRRLL